MPTEAPTTSPQVEEVGSSFITPDMGQGGEVVSLDQQIDTTTADSGEAQHLEPSEPIPQAPTPKGDKTPQRPSLENKDVDLDDFAIAKGEAPAKPTTKPAATPPKGPELAKQQVQHQQQKPATPAQDKKPLEVFDPFKQKKAGQQQTATPAAPTTDATQAAPDGQQRDYSGLAADEVELFKKMGRESFDKLKPMYLEHKTLKAKEAQFAQQLEQAKQGTTRYLEQHERAYVLTPEYNEAVTNQRRAQYEQGFYKQQLANIRAGNKWNELIYENGQYKLGPEHEASPEGEADIIANFNTATNLMQQFQQQAHYIAGQHTQASKQAAQTLKALEDQYFPWYKEDNNPHQSVIKAVIDKIPEPFRHSPLAPWLGKSYALITALSEQLAEALQAAQAQQTIKQDATKAGPNKTQLNNGGSVAPQPEDTMALFQAKKFA